MEHFDGMIRLQTFNIGTGQKNKDEKDDHLERREVHPAWQGEK